MRLSVICGFPPKRIPQENGTSVLLPVQVSRYVLGRVLPDQDHGGPAAGQLASPAAELGRVPRRVIWDNERGIGRGRTRSDGVPAFLATTWSPGWCGHHRGTPNPRASWNDATAGSRPRSCPGGASPRPRVSTTSSPISWPLRTPGWCARARPSPAVGSRSTRRRCWAWPPTTRSTRRRSAACPGPCRRRTGPGEARRQTRRRPSPAVGTGPDHHRHRPCGGRRPATPRVPAAPATTDQSSSGTDNAYAVGSIIRTKRESKVRRRIRTLMAAPLVEEVAVDGRGPIETPPDGTRHRRTNARVARRPR